MPPDTGAETFSADTRGVAGASDDAGVKSGVSVADG